MNVSILMGETISSCLQTGLPDLITRESVKNKQNRKGLGGHSGTFNENKRQHFNVSYTKYFNN